MKKQYAVFLFKNNKPIKEFTSWWTAAEWTDKNIVEVNYPDYGFESAEGIVYWWRKIQMRCNKEKII